jgi:hypothetical protein
VADIVNEQPAPLARPEPVPIVSRKKFGAAYLLLAVIVGAAVGLIVVLATRTDGKSARPAQPSTEQPTAPGTLAARRIARAVSERYRLPDGVREFVAVTANALEVPTADGPVPISALVVSTGLAGVPREGIKVVYPHTGVFYQAAGGGENNLPRGTGSAGEEPLLARESIDLALSTFKELPQTDQILFVLPPLRGVSQTDPRFRRAYYFDRQGLSDELRGPMSATIKPMKTVTENDLTADEANTYMSLVSDKMYHFAVQQLANNSLAIFLTPPAT